MDNAEELVNGSDVFGVDGYLTMLLGMRVPYRLRYQPTAAEIRVWQNLRTERAGRAARSLTVAETLAYYRTAGVSTDRQVYVCS